jgi:pyridoxal phosphate enzyme (YggS family)
MTRSDELAASLTALRKRVATAAAATGRDTDQVRLLPVTKFFPAADVAILHRLGCREFGESREQEATAKVAELRSLPEVRWHMIGRVQRNKVRAIARWADTVHSVDSVRLARALDSAVADSLAAAERDAPLRVLLQVSLDDDPGRGGAPRPELARLADIVAAAGALVLAGVMAIPPLDVSPESAFAALARVHEELLRNHPDATERSAGMSADLEIAVEYGSTCVRVGTALMGARPIISP